MPGQTAEQAFEDPCEGGLAVGVRPVVHRQHRDRHARAAAHEQRDLVVEQAGAVAPAALEVQLPTGGCDLADASALGRHDPREQRHRKGPVAGDHVAVDVQGESGLVGAVISVSPPDRRGREVGHPDAVRNRSAPWPTVSNTIRASSLSDSVIIGPRRSGSVVRGQGSAPDPGLVEVGDHQHRLDHARRPLDVVGSVAVEAAVAGAHRERDVPGPRVGVADRRQRHPAITENNPTRLLRPPVRHVWLGEEVVRRVCLDDRAVQDPRRVGGEPRDARLVVQNRLRDRRRPVDQRRASGHVARTPRWLPGMVARDGCPAHQQAKAEAFSPLRIVAIGNAFL
jgi:hypothetical protein